MSKAPTDYILGHTADFHERLIQQARILERSTIRFFGDAGLKEGMSVLDLGSGIGDVSLLVARLVGPSGRVVGVERDARSLAKAEERARNSGHTNISFRLSDLTQLGSVGTFDAAVGRQILMYLPDIDAYAAGLRSFVRPGGVLAFQEASYESRIVQTIHLPLRLAVTRVIRDALIASGARPDNELPIYRAFKSAGFANIELRNELPLTNDLDNRRWLFGITVAMWSRLTEFGIVHEHIGPIETLEERLDRELEMSNSFAIGPGMACICARNTAPS